MFKLTVVFKRTQALKGPTVYPISRRDHTAIQPITLEISHFWGYS